MTSQLLIESREWRGGEVPIFSGEPIQILLELFDALAIEFRRNDEESGVREPVFRSWRMLDLEIRRIVTDGKQQRIREVGVWEMLIYGRCQSLNLDRRLLELAEQIHRFREGNVDATGRVERARRQQIEQVKPSLRRAFRFGRLDVFVDLGEPLTMVGRAAQHLEIEIDKAHQSELTTDLEWRGQASLIEGPYWSELPQRARDARGPTLHPAAQEVPSPCRVSCSRCSSLSPS